MSEPMTRPGVGTGVYILKGGKVLMGKRRGEHGSGMWCAPGGKVEMYEELEDHCKRETMEECGLEIQNLRLMTATNDPSPEWGTHYITLHFVADWKSGEARETEPDKIGDWQWFDWDTLPDPLFHPARNFVKTGYNPLNF